MRRSIAVALLLSAFPVTVRAETLTEANRAQLCSRIYSGKAAVNLDALALLIVTKAGATMLLDGANSGGARDGAIQLVSTSASLSEPVYAVVNAGRSSPATANRPFGPNVDLSANEAAAIASAAITEELAELASLMVTNVHVSGSVTYRLMRPLTVGSRLARAEAANPLSLFAGAGLVITCETESVTIAEGSTTEPLKPAPTPSSSSIALRPVLRGSVKDLAIASDDLKDAEAATIAYSEDRIVRTTTFELDAVAGLRIGPKSGAFELIPYLSYERKAITGEEGDIETLSPGLLAGWHYRTPEFGFDARMEGSFIDDMEQGSHQGKIRLYVDPAIWLGRDIGTLFGGNLQIFSPLLLRPKLTLIADASKVWRAGASEELAEAENYWGFGGDLSLRARLNVGSPISNFVITGGVRHLELRGGIGLRHARRWYGSLEFAPDTFPYLGLALEFNDGRNDDTFQREDTYGLALRLRY
ncbi:hypothetical protein ACMGDM_20360 [Sphingomonas sp. DT-51]|uniref:hypothetical protein n=1 Tax=Sphingomonas sp. DT-51 TaxID=3396165 RepID=UPI003F198B12